LYAKAKGLIEKYAKKALRTFAFGFKDLEENEGGENHDEKEEDGKAYKIESSGLTLICLCGIKDIIREEVPGAVALCNEAGVRVRIVTGDNKTTAIAIAKECGIIYDGEEVENKLICMEGPEFNEYVGSLVSKKTK
jgi:Ca2+ transporting ATPase